GALAELERPRFTLGNQLAQVRPGRFVQRHYRRGPDASPVLEAVQSPGGLRQAPGPRVRKIFRREMDDSRLGSVNFGEQVGGGHRGLAVRLGGSSDSSQRKPEPGGAQGGLGPGWQVWKYWGEHQQGARVRRPRVRVAFRDCQRWRRWSIRD